VFKQSKKFLKLNNSVARHVELKARTLQAIVPSALWGAYRVFDSATNKRIS